MFMIQNYFPKDYPVGILQCLLKTNFTEQTSVIAKRAAKKRYFQTQKAISKINSNKTKN